MVVLHIFRQNKAEIRGLTTTFNCRAKSSIERPYTFFHELASWTLSLLEKRAKAINIEI